MKKFLSAVLAVVMLFSLGVTAFAADYNDAYVQVDLDGRNIYATSRTSSGYTDILTTGARDLESLEVNGTGISLNAVNATAAAADTRYANGYDATSGTYKIYSEIVNGVRVVRISWNNLRTSLFVTAESTVHGSYTVIAKSSPSGACEISNTKTVVDADDSYETTFKPASGSQEIQGFTFNVNGVTRDVSVPTTGSISVTVANQDIDIVRVDGAVTIRVARVTADITITAQVYNYGSRHLVTVNADAGIKSTVTSDYVSNGTREVITLTPVDTVNIGQITISSENRVYTVSTDEDTARVNNMYFEITRSTNGTVKLVIDKVYADVDFRVFADNDTARVEVVANRNYAYCDKYGMNYVRIGQPFTVRFDAKNDVMLAQIKITTANGTYKADTDDDTIRVNGQYFDIYRNVDGDVTLSIRKVMGNMKIELIARDTVHTVKATTDGRVTADITKTDVYDGDAIDIKFTPKSSSNDIRTISITTGGRTYTADPTVSKYVSVDGAKWYFSYGTDGAVTVECDYITADTTVYASTVKNASSSSSSSSSSNSGTYRITKTPDTHSNITYTGTNPFDAGSDSDIRVFTDSGYILKTVKLTVNGRSASVPAFTETVKVDGETYTLTWKSNADVTIKLTNMYANVTVSATSAKGTEISVEVNDGNSSNSNSGDSTTSGDMNVSDGNFSQTTTPTIPDNTPAKGPGVGAYHPAYMYGFSDNTFRPDQSMTRAQAVAILARLYSGILDSDFKIYAGNPGFQDVNPNSTFAGYIGYAKQQGYLAGIVGSGLNFYPNKAITRAEFCYLLVKFMNCDVVGVSTAQVFGDVPTNHWAIVYVNYCASRGWANGYADGIFKPDSSLTRAQICAIVNRINGRAVANTTVGFKLRTFNDVTTAHWAYSDIMEATHNHTVKAVADGTETWAV